MEDSHYDVAQICKNGHVVNSMARDYPQTNSNYCAACGEETITSCLHCGIHIRGYYHVPGVFGSFNYSAPSYCFSCGKAFPWTLRRLKAAEMLTEQFDLLSRGEQQELKDSIPILITSGPETIIAESKFKKLMKKAGVEAREGMRKVLIDIVSETVRKSIFPGP